MKLSLINEVGRRDFFRKLLNPLGDQPVEKSTGSTTDKPEDQPKDDIDNIIDKAVNTPIDRRDFLKKTGRAAVAAGMPGGNLLKIAGTAASANKISKSIYDNMSDKELLRIPEEKWLGNIDPARQRYIVKNNPEHGKYEAVSKIVKIITYRVTNHHTSNKELAKMASEIAERGTKALKKITGNWKLKASELSDIFQQEWGGIGLLGRSDSGFDDFLRKNASKYNIENDMKPKPKEKPKQPGKPVTKPDDIYDHDIARWENEGGLFEAKLTKILSIYD